MIHTHAHIYASEFDNDRDEVVQRALTQGINKILLPNIDWTLLSPCYKPKRHILTCATE